MKLGIDLDGVMYPFVEVFKKWSEGHLGRKLPDVETWNFPTDQWGIESMEQFVALMAKSCQESCLWWDGYPERDSREVLERLRRKGHKVFILTDRSPKGGESVAERATYTWLRRHRIPYDGLFIGRDKTGLGIDVLLDDGPHNIEKARAAGEFAVTYDRPWNKSVPGPRVRSWSAFEFCVENLEVLSGK